MLNRMDEYEADRGHSLKKFKGRDCAEDERRVPAALYTNVYELRDLQLLSLMISSRFLDMRGPLNQYHPQPPPCVPALLLQRC